MRKQIYFLVFAFAGIFLSSCETPITGISISEASLNMAVGDTATLTAAIIPADAEGIVSWSTSNADVVTVTDGMLIAKGQGEATVTATVKDFSASCTVTVEPAKGDYSASLKGSNYYLFFLDGVTAANIADKVVADYRPDETTRFLWVWDATYIAGESTGPNFYGEVEPWTSLAVSNIGWSGAGLNCSDLAALDQMATITDNASDYYLHIGIRSKDNATHLIGLDGQSKAAIAIGASSFVDNGTVFEPYTDFTRDGEWQQIEIPVTVLKEKGLLYTTGNTSPKNVFWFLSGGVTGVTFDIDAIFFYKK